MNDVFQNIYDTNFWEDKESVSGPGSNLKATETIREQLPTLFKELGITSMLDAACGDLNWVRHIKFPPNFRYVGMDIVPRLIDANINNLDYFEDGWFELGDISKDELPKVDLIFARDVLVHFSNADIRKALKNFRVSGSTYLMATTFPGANPNADITTGQWRPVDLSALRYGLGQTTILLSEGAKGKFSNKSLGVWELNR